MQNIFRHETGWRLRAGGLELNIDRQTGCLSRLAIVRDKEHVWTEQAGDVTVRDDRLERTFGARHLEKVGFEEKGNALIIRKMFRGAPWQLTETYRVDSDALAWEAAVTLDTGDYRSCAIGCGVPWSQPIHDVEFWAAREGMPSAPHRYAGIDLEYGEVTSGILLPALCCYLPKHDAGLLLAMPFEFRTPRFRFVSQLREPNLVAEFDWLALAPGRPARASLILRASGGHWRPALGWLSERFKEFFEPRSTLIHQLWGGHVSGRCDVTAREARVMADLGLKWHEIHLHFPAYGNYHPARAGKWKTGHHPDRFTKWITPAMIRRTIRNLHAAGAAALPYLQVTGDGAAQRLPAKFAGSRVRDRRGELVYNDYYAVYQMNSDPALPFGRDITRQIAGMVARYPEMDGVFLDQACYNFLDTAHDDGVTAVDNRPCYMQGWNYAPHLEQLSALLHPRKAIIANGPFGIGIMKYIDGFMAEGSGWLCDHFQYYALVKPMFFLMEKTGESDIELMFRRCLLYGAGYSSYAAAAGSKQLYRCYTPLIERLFRRRWVFDPDPLQLPATFKGNLFRSERGTLIASLVSHFPSRPGRPAGKATVAVCARGTEQVKQALLYAPGSRPQALGFSNKDGKIQFDVPGDVVAGVVEFGG